MSYYEKEKIALERQVSDMKKVLIGATITDVDISVEYPGQFGKVEITLSNGKKLTVSSGGGGCSECDPDGIGWGVSVDL